MHKSITIFGSTGTIGKKAIEIAHSNRFEIIAISGNKNYEELIRQAKKYKPKYVCSSDSKSFIKIKEALSNCDIEVLSGSEIENIGRLDVDCCVMAISGSTGLSPTFSCLGHAKRLVIANKESIILGGKLLIDFAKSKGTEIIPIDSEHNAIFQCINGENNSISEIILTASGGPFLDVEEKELAHISVLDALKHPNWVMGEKVTIDSATLMNKAFEIIEATYLFNFPIERITPLIHPNSIIHGLVKFTDNSFKALLSYPDMMLPISFAINYPDRKDCKLPNIDFSEIGTLSFKKAKQWQRRNLDLAYKVFKEKRVIAFNTANEIAVSKFLKHEIKFSEIYSTIMRILEQSNEEHITSLEDIKELILKYEGLTVQI
jgi:1-deoxy-D-xylulose-5-phosphate reductoisomerase